MTIPDLPALRIGDLTARLPLVQGGMGVGISLHRLASAVANEGGIGVISAALIGMSEPDMGRNFLEANIRALKREIRRARELTNGILGVNIMVALSNFADMVTTAISEGIDVIFAGAGLPLDLPSYLSRTSKTKLVPIVSSVRSLRVIYRRWLKYHDYLPDAVVVEGPLAGGHLGFKTSEIDDSAYSLESLVPDIVSETRALEQEHGKSIPVIAAGGIYTGQDMHRFMAMGAAGVQMGTRFVATYECDAPDEFKQSYIDCNSSDITIIDSPVGLPGRAIRNKFLDDVDRGVRRPVKCPYHCIKTCDVERTPYCISLALSNAKSAKLSNGLIFAGASAARVERITSVRDLIAELLQEYTDACAASQEATASSDLA